MTSASRVLTVLISLLLIFCGCIKRPGDGYRPPAADDPLNAFRSNWEHAEVVSGVYKVIFTYENGDRVSLNADMVIEPRLRARVDLIYNGTTKFAIVTLTPEFINLLNIRERYFIREVTSPENAGKMIGIYLPPQEVSALLCGEGFIPDREQVYTDPDGEGGISLRLFHSSEDFRAIGRIDRFGRLRSIRYINAITEELLIVATYREFRLDRRSGLVWPGRIEIYLPKSGEKILFLEKGVDINEPDVQSRFETIFAKLERGDRIRLENIPPGPPLLYRSVKEYAEK